MFNRIAIIGSLASFGFLLGINSGQAVAQMTHEKMQPSGTEPKNQVQRFEQPLWVKGAVTAGGLGLIGLELWWFLLSKPILKKLKQNKEFRK